MAMPQRDNAIEEIRRTDALLGARTGSDMVTTVNYHSSGSI